MKAVVHSTHGPPDVLRLQDVGVPEIRDGDVLVRVRAASVNPYDWHVLTGLPYVGRAGGGITALAALRDHGARTGGRSVARGQAQTELSFGTAGP